MAPTTPDDLLMVIQAIYPPGARRIVDHLRASRSQSLDDLAVSSRMSLGSTCHHLRELYKAGVAEPDPEHTDEHGRSWWRLIVGTLWWNPNEFPLDSQMRQRLEAATQANIRHQYKSLQDFLSTEPLESPWRARASVTESLARVTADEMEELMRLVNDAVDGWIDKRRAQETTDDGQERRPIRITNWIHPIA